MADAVITTQSTHRPRWGDFAIVVVLGVAAAWLLAVSSGVEMALNRHTKTATPPAHPVTVTSTCNIPLPKGARR